MARKIEHFVYTDPWKAGDRAIRHDGVAGTIVAIWERANPTSHPAICEVHWDTDTRPRIELIASLLCPSK